MDRPNRSSFGHTDLDATAAHSRADWIRHCCSSPLYVQISSPNHQLCSLIPVHGPSTVDGACSDRSFASNTRATVSNNRHFDCVVDGVDGL